MTESRYKMCYYNVCSDYSNSNILGNLVDAPFIQVLLLHFLWTIIILLDIYRLRLGFLLLRVWFWRKRRERKRNFKKYVWIPHLCHTILIQNGTRYPKLNKICNSAYLGARLLGMKYGYIYPLHICIDLRMLTFWSQKLSLKANLACYCCTWNGEFEGWGAASLRERVRLCLNSYLAKLYWHKPNTLIMFGSNEKVHESRC